MSSGQSMQLDAKQWKNIARYKAMEKERLICTAHYLFLITRRVD
jgi:hypothetical protein